MTRSENLLLFCDQSWAAEIAVIENEIGALGVDGALVANAHAEVQTKLT